MLKRTLLGLFFIVVMVVSTSALHAQEFTVNGQKFKVDDLITYPGVDPQGFPITFDGAVLCSCPEDDGSTVVSVPPIVRWNGKVYRVTGIYNWTSKIKTVVIEDSPQPFDYSKIPTNIIPNISELYIGRPTMSQKNDFAALSLKKLGVGPAIEELNDQYSCKLSSSSTFYLSASTTPLRISKAMLQKLNSGVKYYCLYRDIDQVGNGLFEISNIQYIEIGKDFTNSGNHLINPFRAKVLMIPDLAEYCEKVLIQSALNANNVCTMYRCNYRSFTESSVEGELSDFAWPITELQLGGGYPSVPDYAFYYARDLKNLVIANSYRGSRIGSMAFYNYSEAGSLTIPNGVEEIANSAFFKMTQFKDLTFESGDKSLKLACSNFGGGDISIDCLTLGRTIELVQGNWQDKSPFIGAKIRKIVLLDGVVDIPDYLFKSSFSLGSSYPLTIPESVVSIGVEAFRLNFFKEINIGRNVKKIGSLAFADLDAELLENVTCRAVVPPTMPKDVFLRRGLASENNDIYKIYNEIPLHVPVGTAEIYASDPSWGQFKNIIDDITLTPEFSFAESQMSVKISQGTLTLELINSSSANPEYSSSNPDVASVDSVTGLITLHSAGTTTITAKIEATGCYSEGLAYCNLTIQPKVAVQSIDITPEEIDYSKGDEVRLWCSINPSYADERTPQWSVSDPSLAQIVEAQDTYCVVRCLGESDFSVTAECDGVSATADFIFIPEPVSYSISVSPSALSLYVGDSETLTAVVTASDGFSPAVSWRSSNTNVAEVSDNGVVTAKEAGNASIIATVGDVSAYCAVTVTNQPEATQIAISPAVITLEIGQGAQLQAQVSGGDFTSSDVRWTSENADIAEVADNGYVTAYKVGRATICATVGTYQATCQVTVIEPEPVNPPDPPVTPDPSNEVIIDKAIYTVFPEQGTAELSSYESGIDKLVIPSELNYEGRNYKVTEIKTRALYRSGVRSVTIPASIERIGNEAIGYCEHIESLIFEDSPQPIAGDNYVINCSGVDYLYLGRNVIGEESYWFFRGDIKEAVIGGFVTTLPTFYGSERLERVEIRSALKAIDDIFRDCPALKEVVLPAELETLLWYAFDNDYAIRSMTVLAPNPPDEGHFEDEVYSDATLYVPESSLELYKTAKGWKNFMKILPINASGISEIVGGETAVTVYDLCGRFVFNDAPIEMLRTLPSGFYIVNNRKIFIQN